MTSHFQEICQMCHHSRNIDTANYEHKYEVWFLGFIWPFLISFISRLILVVATWNKQQKILCDPCFHIHSLYFGFSHILFFFGVTIFWCYHCVWLHYSSIRSSTYTKVHTPRSIHQGPYTKLLSRVQMSIHLSIFI